MKNTTTTTPRAHLGSISTGTLRNKDLFQAFTAELDRIDHDLLANWLNGLDREERGALNALTGDARRLTDAELECACGLIDELADRLNELAPPLCFFGAHPGDGADFGFWFSPEMAQEALQDGELIGLDEPPADWKALDKKYRGISFFSVRNDHGNLTVYSPQGDILLEVV